MNVQLTKQVAMNVTIYIMFPLARETLHAADIAKLTSAPQNIFNGLMQLEPQKKHS